MIKQYKNVFTKKECKKIINECFIDLKKLLNTDPFSPEGNFIFIYDRKIMGTVLEKTDPRIEWLMLRLADIIGTSIDNLEYPRFKKYDEGGEYKRHYDFVFLDKPYAFSHLKTGGQRIKSHLIYLNDDFDGGFTEFPHWNVMVKPEVGKVLSWTNVKEGVPTNLKESIDLDSQHGGTSIKNGNKYIIIVFEKENKFIGETKDWFSRFKEEGHLP